MARRSGAFHGMLVGLAGADPEVLRVCPGEGARAARLGGTILTTAVAAGFGMLFALRAALHLWLPFAVALATGWSVAVANLDAWLVAALRPQRTPARTVLLAAPRVVLAFLVGFVISIPLVLQIFDHEIRSEVVALQQRRKAELLASLARDPQYAQIPALQRQADQMQRLLDVGTGRSADDDPRVVTLGRQLDQAEAAYQRAEQNVVCEKEGTCGSGKVGAGIAYAEKVAIRDRLARRRDELSAQLGQARTAAAARVTAEDDARRATARGDLPAVRNRLSSLVAGRDAQVARIDTAAAGDDGLLARLEGLHQLVRRDPTLALAYGALSLLLLAVDCLPVLGKLLLMLGEPSPYQRALRSREEDLLEREAARLEAERRIAIGRRRDEADRVADELARRRDERTAHRERLAARRRLDARLRRNEDDARAAADRRVTAAVLDLWADREIRRAREDPDAFLLPPDPDGEVLDLR